MNTRLALAMAALAMAAGCGDATTPATLENLEVESEKEDRAMHAGPIVGDVNWLLYVASYDVSEMKLARLAQSRGSNALVQEFGAVKQTRHQRSFDEASRLAAQSNNLLPASVTATGEQQYQRLRYIGASLFDREFLALQVQLHREAANAAAEAAGQAPAGPVREWASRAWGRWHRDETWAGRLYGQVLTGHASMHTSDSVGEVRQKMAER